MIKKSFIQEQDSFPILEVRVIDGDTIEALVVLPFDERKRQRIRLKGWWADELRGPFAQQGLTAALRLEKFCKDKALWIVARGHRKDKYGRIVAHLMTAGSIVRPSDVLGDLSLTEKVHKAHHDEGRRRVPTLLESAPTTLEERFAGEGPGHFLNEGGDLQTWP